jgi:hypothetical protein
MRVRSLVALSCLAATACTDLAASSVAERSEPTAEPVEIVIQERIQVSD